MPRTGHLHAPGILHHIIVRGIEKKPIFKNDSDRNDFKDRMDILFWVQRVSRIRSIFIRIAISELGYRGVEISRWLLMRFWDFSNLI